MTRQRKENSEARQKVTSILRKEDSELRKKCSRFPPSMEAEKGWNGGHHVVTMVYLGVLWSDVSMHGYVLVVLPVLTFG